MSIESFVRSIVISMSIGAMGCSAAPDAPEPLSVEETSLRAHCPLPAPRLTPGKLCTPDDPTFAEYRYPEQIPYCRRKVSDSEKQRVADAYRISDSWTGYEFDHYIPLSLGGANDDSNLWPEPHPSSDDKDRLEQELFNELSRGDITQADAVAQIKA